jgi:hypothetical protein
MVKPRHPGDERAAREVFRADYFTATRKIGVGKYDTRRAPSLAEADALRAAMGPDQTLVYAVSPERMTFAVDDTVRALLPEIEAELKAAEAAAKG